MSAREILSQLPPFLTLIAFFVAAYCVFQRRWGALIGVAITWLGLLALCLGCK